VPVDKLLELPARNELENLVENATESLHRRAPPCLELRQPDSTGTRRYYIFLLYSCFGQVWIDTLPSTLFVFGIMGGLATYLISNHVRGVHAAASGTITRARNTIWSFRDKYREADDPAVEVILVMNLLDLASLREVDWLEPNNIRGWSRDLDEHLHQLADPRERVEVFSRYLMPIQEAIDELTVLWVRSVTGELHLKSISGTFLLVVISAAINVVVRVLPSGRLCDLFAIGLAALVVVMALLELLMIFGFVSLEASDESAAFRSAEESRVVAQETRERNGESEGSA